MSFLARDSGKQRGAAKRARKPKSPFGACLERLSHVRITYIQRETRDLVTLQSAEMIESPFALSSSYECGIALDYMAEVAEHLLPAEEVNERFFRLILAMIEHLKTKREAAVWPAVLYFSLWAVRLSGILGELRVREESAALAQQMLLLPIAKLPEREWSSATAKDLRRILIHEIERHVERKLFTVPMLESL